MSGEKIAGYLRSIVNKGEDITQYLVMCTVTGVSDFACDCAPINGEADLLNVRLVAEDSDSNFIIYPTEGSVVGVLMMTSSEQTDSCVVLFSEIDIMKLRGSQFGGLAKVEVLTEKYNNLENKVNDLINAYNAHTHAGVQTGAGSSAVTTSIITGTLTPTNQSEIENENVQHG
jgi:hypothetical protein